MADLTFDKEKVAQLRRDYMHAGLDREDLHEDPIIQFERWLQDAVDANLRDATAMTLATADARGNPSARIVLLKDVEDGRFVFYTNYGSRKAREIEENPRVSLCFYWDDFDRQVRIFGSAGRVPREQSAAYFKSRPRESQIGAWASHQSAEVSGREQLDEQYKKYEKKFGDEEIPLPDFWGGYAIRPERIEFWQGRPSRMHDRFEYRRRGEEWQISRLSP